MGLNHHNADDYHDRDFQKWQQQERQRFKRVGLSEELKGPEPKKPEPEKQEEEKDQ